MVAITICGILILVIFLYLSIVKPTEPISLNEWREFKIGANVIIEGGEYYKMKGVITKIIDHAPQHKFLGHDAYVDIYVKILRSTNSENLDGEVILPPYLVKLDTWKL